MLLNPRVHRTLSYIWSVDSTNLVTRYFSSTEQLKQKIIDHHKTCIFNAWVVPWTELPITISFFSYSNCYRGFRKLLRFFLFLSLFVPSSTPQWTHYFRPWRQLSSDMTGSFALALVLALDSVLDSGPEPVLNYQYYSRYYDCYYPDPRCLGPQAEWARRSSALDWYGGERWEAILFATHRRRRWSH